MTKKIKYGWITIEVPDHVVPPKGAGSLPASEVKSIPRARAGIGLACDATADALENEDVDFTPPKGVTADGLRKAGKRAEDTDIVIKHLEGALEIFKQGNLLVDAEAFEMLSKVNDQVKVQGKRDKAVATAFSAVRTYFKVGGAKPKKQKARG